MNPTVGWRGYSAVSRVAVGYVLLGGGITGAPVQALGQPANGKICTYYLLQYSRSYRYIILL